jgi:hypothetical protein
LATLGDTGEGIEPHSQWLTKDSTIQGENDMTRTQRYRTRHPRIDYYPSPDVLAILRHHCQTTGEPCLAGIIDGLVRIAHRVMVSGNGK